MGECTRERARQCDRENVNVFIIAQVVRYAIVVSLWLSGNREANVRKKPRRQADRENSFQRECHA